MFYCCGKQNMSLSQVIPTALCCLSKINALQRVGIVSRKTYLFAVNFYRSEFSLDEVEDDNPLRLTEMAMTTVMHHMTKSVSWMDHNVQILSLPSTSFYT